MKLAEFIEKMNNEIAHYETATRKERASLLVWFLINYFRLDEDTAVDMVCDSDNDKGIDGIFIDDQTEEAFIFQSKNSQIPCNPLGDNDLRNFKGARAWFDSIENLEKLDRSSASLELKSLVERTDIFEKVNRGYKLFMVFVTNKRFNKESKDYLMVLGDEIEAWDIDRLFEHYTYTGKDKPIEDTFSFSINRNFLISYKINEGVTIAIFPAKAQDIINLKGIQDKTLFARNVRYGLGRTRVNKDITKTLKNTDEHENFFLYHNGITLVCTGISFEDIDDYNQKVSITNYSIVNGCQSTLSFYENKQYLTDKVKILIRVIQTGEKDRLSQDITYYTNNQNAISLKDLKSNDKIQQDLQDAFLKLFNNNILYKIKNGEDETNYKQIIENDFASQLITSFYLNDPSSVHQKTQNFTDNYVKIFNRNITALYIFLLAEIYRAIDKNCAYLEDEGIRSYKLTRFFFLYVFRLVFNEDSVGKEFLLDQQAFYRIHKEKYFEAFEKLFKILAIDFNQFIKQEKKSSGYFDYKNSLRNASKVEAMAEELLAAYKKLLIFHEEDAFHNLL